VIQGSDGRRRYHPDSLAPRVAFEIADHDGRESPWREATRRLLQVDASPSEPLAAVAVLRDRSRRRCDLIFAVHHGIADGRSGLMLLGDLLAEYANAEAHLEAPDAPSLQIISAARATPSGGWVARWRLIRRTVRLQLAERRSGFTPLPRGFDVPPLSQWVHWVFSREETVALVRRCRKEQVSLGGVLVSAVYCGLMDCLPVSQAVFKWHSAFDVREALQGPAGPVTARDLGCFMSLMRGICSISQPPVFWDLARQVHAEVQAFVAQGGPALAYNMAAMWVSPIARRVEPTLLQSRSKRPTLFATNYGMVDIRDTYGSLRPRECTLMFIGDESARPWLTMEALVLGQRLNVGFAADGLDRAFWERLQVVVRGQLDKATAARTVDSASTRHHFD
jgi:hypothetical protein